MPYTDLLHCVQQTMFVGQREIDEAWVRTYHETGRLIVSHILLDKRADYGARVYRGLARDTGASERKPYECVPIYRSCPIFQPTSKLGWTRCQSLRQRARRQTRSGTKFLTTDYRRRALR